MSSCISPGHVIIGSSLTQLSYFDQSSHLTEVFTPPCLSTSYIHAPFVRNPFCLKLVVPVFVQLVRELQLARCALCAIQPNANTSATPNNQSCHSCATSPWPCCYTSVTPADSLSTSIQELCVQSQRHFVGLRKLR